MGKIVLMQTTCMKKKFGKDFVIKNSGEYYDYVQSDTLLLAGVFENF